MLQLSRQSWNSEKAELFKKIEPYLTFIDIQPLERKGADLETQNYEKLTKVWEIGTNKGRKGEENLMKGYHN